VVVCSSQRQWIFLSTAAGCCCGRHPHDMDGLCCSQVTTALKPQDNSLLEGLYKSGGNYCTQVCPCLPACLPACLPVCLPACLRNCCR